MSGHAPRKPDPSDMVSNAGSLWNRRNCTNKQLWVNEGTQKLFLGLSNPEQYRSYIPRPVSSVSFAPGDPFSYFHIPIQSVRGAQTTTTCYDRKGTLHFTVTKPTFFLEHRRRVEISNISASRSTHVRWRFIWSASKQAWFGGIRSMYHYVIHSM